MRQLRDKRCNVAVENWWLRQQVTPVHDQLSRQTSEVAKTGEWTDNRNQTYHPSGGIERLRVTAFPATTKARTCRLLLLRSRTHVTSITVRQTEKPQKKTNKKGKRHTLLASEV